MDLHAPITLGDAQVDKAMQDRQVGALAACEKSKVAFYVNNVRGGVSLESYQPAAYLAAVADRPRRARLAQLRTGSHWLRVESGRWQRLERDQRVCSHCVVATVEDESHMVFDCPKYAGLRQQYADLFAVDSRELYLSLIHI